MVFGNVVRSTLALAGSLPMASNAYPNSNFSNSGGLASHSLFILEMMLEPTSLLGLSSCLLMVVGLMYRHRRELSVAHSFALRAPVSTGSTNSSVGSFVMPRSSSVAQMGEVLDKEVFNARLVTERARSERSRRPFVLMLIDSKDSVVGIERAIPFIASATRGTDLIGWCDQGQTLGVIFTEINCGQPASAVEILRAKINKSLRDNLGFEEAAKVGVYVVAFPAAGPDKADGPDKTVAAPAQIGSVAAAQAAAATQIPS